MSMLKIKKGDTVKVIAGKDKDKEGKVLSVNQKEGTVLVEGINMLTKHTKPSVFQPERRYHPPGRPDRYFQRDVCSQRKSDQSRIQDGWR